MSTTPVLDVIADVAQLVRQAPNGTLIRAYVRAARKFCRESRWYRATLTGACEAGTRTYSLGSDTYTEVLGLKAVGATKVDGTQPWSLGVSDSTTWAQTTDRSKPRRYAYVPEAQLALDPIPDADYPLTITLVLQPKMGANEIPTALLTKWDQVLQAGTLAYLFGIPGQAWADPLQAEKYRREFQSGISNARADEQREFNAGTQFIRRRPFIVGGRP